jgi:hypothetical protein
MKLLALATLLATSASFAQNYDEIRRMDQKEDFLESFDIHDDSLSFKRLGGTTPTNWMVKKDGKPVVNLKCTKKNTNHKGAIVAYEFGRALGFNIYPVATTVNLNRSIKYSYKQNGVKKYATVTKNEECALKEWSSDFAQYYWTKGSFTSGNSRKIRMSNYLKCSTRKDSTYNSGFLYYSNTRYGNPDSEMLGRADGQRVVYRGVESSYKKAAKDFSNMMVMDAIIGNDDRFPGGNLHFRTETGKYTNSRGQIVFDSVRLFSLDNESAMRGGASVGMRDLKTFVSRFDEDFISKLKDLESDLSQYHSNSSIKKKYSYLEFKTWNKSKHIVDYLLSNIRTVLELVKKSESKCGVNNTYF